MKEALKAAMLVSKAGNLFFQVRQPAAGQAPLGRARHIRPAALCAVPLRHSHARMPGLLPATLPPH
jgi:hypothetical protein